MLCQFMDGSVAPPVFLISDRSLPPDQIVKIEVPGLSPYSTPFSVGHIWVAKPSDGGNRTFYGNYFRDIVLPTFRAKADEKRSLERPSKRARVGGAARPQSTLASNVPNQPSPLGLDAKSLSLLAFDGEISQLAQATSNDRKPLLSAACLDLLKLNAALSFSLSACDAGHTHSLIHHDARNISFSKKPDHVHPNPVLAAWMQARVNEERKKIGALPSLKVRLSTRLSWNKHFFVILGCVAVPTRETFPRFWKQYQRFQRFCPMP